MTASEVTNSIAFIGKMGSGKTEAAKALQQEFGYVPLHFASPVKEIAQSLFPNPKREEYQKVGVMMREIDPQVWVKQVERTIALNEAASFSDAVKLTIDDCRFPNEYQFLAMRGWTFIRIECEEGMRVDRLMRDDRMQKVSQLTHESEVSLDETELFPCQYTVTNEGDKVDLYNQICKIAESVVYNV